MRLVLLRQDVGRVPSMLVVMVVLVAVVVVVMLVLVVIVAVAVVAVHGGRVVVMANPSIVVTAAMAVVLWSLLL